MFSPFFATFQIYVHGESLKSSLVAVVVVDAETIIGWSIKKGISAKGLELLIKDPKLNEVILADMNAVGKVRDLKSFELVRNMNVLNYHRDCLLVSFNLTLSVTLRPCGSKSTR